MIAVSHTITYVEQPEAILPAVAVILALVKTIDLELHVFDKILNHRKEEDDFSFSH